MSNDTRDMLGSVALLVIGAIVILLAATCVHAATPRFVTPEMTLRNGLTDAQYEKLWKVGKHPSIDQKAARDWMFRAYRYENTTNWFNIIGKTNDFARLVLPTLATNEWLVATNASLRSSVRRLERENEDLWRWYTNTLERAEVLSRKNFELEKEMTNGLYAIEKTDRFYQEREESAPDEKLRTIYHEMRDHLAIIRREFETPPNKEETK